LINIANSQGNIIDSKRHTHTLTIAGFDGCGGAGIQGDLKTFSALECFAATALTALPIQNTQGVRSIYPIADQCIEDQILAILEDIEIDAIKIGMVHRPEIVHILSKILLRYPHIKCVLDPVANAKNGHELLIQSAAKAMQNQLFPLMTVVTPNLLEASLFLQREINTKLQMEKAALDLVHTGPGAVLVKGGHLLEGDCDDCLCIKGLPEQIHWISSPRINTKNTHGTGCTLSAAITAFLAKGHSILASVKKAKQYVHQCIEAGSVYNVGKGNGPLHHFFSLWPKKSKNP
jgi:hydroxymethylpyrimidine/phosphomethylpyrimidine kinase